MLFSKSWIQTTAAVLHDFGWRHGPVEQGSGVGFYLPDEVGGHKGFCLGSDEKKHFAVYIFLNNPIKDGNFSEAVMLANAINHKLHFGSLEVTLDNPHQFVSKACLFWSAASAARGQISEGIRLCANNLGAYQMPLDMVVGGGDHKKALKLHELACEATAGSLPIQRTRN